MRILVWRKLGLAAIAASLVIAVDGGGAAWAQTPKPLNGLQIRLTRKGEKPVIPTLGRDVWRLKADLALPASFDPHLKSIQIQVTGSTGAVCSESTPCADGSVCLSGACYDIDHVHPMVVPQLLPKSSVRWTIRQNVPNNGECTVLLLPKIIKWTLFVKCQGTSILPPFPESTEFTATVQIGQIGQTGSHVFTSAPADLRHLRVTTRRYP